jgi:hypothetical protein
VFRLQVQLHSQTIKIKEFFSGSLKQNQAPARVMEWARARRGKGSVSAEPLKNRGAVLA